MFERFTDRARRVVPLAQEEARMLNHNYIGTEHILLGLLREGEGVAAKALESLGISLDAVRQQVEEIIGQGQQAPSGPIPFTPRAKKVLELSLREALQLGQNYIGTEHILLGLIREGDGVAAQVLIRLGADLNRVRQQIIALLYRSKESRLDRRSAEEGALLPEVQARLDAVEDWLAAVEQRVGTGPDTSDLDEQSIGSAASGWRRPVPRRTTRPRRCVTGRRNCWPTRPRAGKSGRPSTRRCRSWPSGSNSSPTRPSGCAPCSASTASTRKTSQSDQYDTCATWTGGRASDQHAGSQGRGCGGRLCRGSVGLHGEPNLLRHRAHGRIVAAAGRHAWLLPRRCRAGGCRAVLG
jgi:Clp amino terminal domain, pathogenicity island component